MSSATGADESVCMPRCYIQETKLFVYRMFSPDELLNTFRKSNTNIAAIYVPCYFCNVVLLLLLLFFARACSCVCGWVGLCVCRLNHRQHIVNAQRLLPLHLTPPTAPPSVHQGESAMLWFHRCPSVAQASASSLHPRQHHTLPTPFNWLYTNTNSLNRHDHYLDADSVSELVKTP